MFPPVNTIPKMSAEDTSIVVGNVDGATTAIPCPTGTNIIIHTPGLHYNRMLFLMSNWHWRSTNERHVLSDL
jgi:hypothetical protein